MLTAQCTNCHNQNPEKQNCYHCLATGEIDIRLYFDDLVRDYSLELAHIKVKAIIKDLDQDSDGENWAFRAAENMMSESDYTKCMIEEHSYDILKELYDIKPELLKLILLQTKYLNEKYFNSI